MRTTRGAIFLWVILSGCTATQLRYETLNESGTVESLTKRHYLVTSTPFIHTTSTRTRRALPVSSTAEARLRFLIKWNSQPVVVLRGSATVRNLESLHGRGPVRQQVWRQPAW
jgi:pyruvate dehydrogenase complex dehydrogenase (E1) component